MKNLTTSPNEKSIDKMLNDYSIDAIIAVDENKKIIAWNNVAEKVYAKKKADVVGKIFFEAIPSTKEDTATLTAIDRALKGIKSFVPASDKFYHRSHAENHFIPLKENETVIGVMNLVHDVAHRIKAEKQLQFVNEELNKSLRQLKIISEELASFTYVTTNKIKDPIRHIYTGIEQLIKTEARNLSDSGKATFRRMQSSLNRMDLLLDDILSLSQISALQKQEAVIDLKALVYEVAETVQAKTDKSVSIITGDLGSITGYKNYIQVLLLNLFDNAIKFNGKDVTIKISCENVSVNNELPQLVSNIEYYKLTVEDNGIGIEEKDYEKIFGMFEKLHDKQYRGSGVGLAVAQKIMEAHEGFIKVESKPGVGSAFSCYFPIIKTN